MTTATPDALAMPLLPLAAALLMSPLAAPPSSAAAVPPANLPTTTVPPLLARGPDVLPQSRVRAPVLQEGAYLAGAKGYFARSIAEPGLLVFALEEGMLSNVRRTLLVMPCDPSDDVKAILSDITVDTPALFQVSGRVYDYRGRAFLLPVSVVALKNPPAPEFLARVPAPGTEEAAKREPARPPRLDAYADADARTLDTTPIRDVPRDRMAHEPDPSIFPALDDGMAEELERRLEKGIAKSGTGTALHPPMEQADRSAMLPPATRLQGRRAAVLRDPVTGAWRARLDAARAGEGTADGAEVTLELLPTKALERLERRVREQPVGTAWLLSGEVVVSKDRGYLLLERADAVAPDRFISP